MVMERSGQQMHNHHSQWTRFHIISCDGLPLMTGYVILWLTERPTGSLLPTELKTSKAFNVVECPEFRSLLLYIEEGKIVDKDISHRTKVTNMIHEEY